MNRYVVFLTSIFLSLQSYSMEIEAKKKPRLHGTIDICGPILYGPKQYYDHLNRCGIPSELYELLVKVKVKIHNNEESLTSWKKSKKPNVVQEYEENHYKQKYETSTLSNEIKFKIKQKYFPKYIPVLHLMQNKSTNQLMYTIYGYPTNLTCNSNGLNSFTESLSGIVSNCTIEPRFFKWSLDRWGKRKTFCPKEELIEEGLIQQKDSEQKGKEENITYGEKGLNNVARLVIDFALCSYQKDSNLTNYVYYLLAQMCDHPKAKEFLKSEYMIYRRA